MVAAVCAAGLSIVSPAEASDNVPGWKLINIDIDHSISSQKKVTPHLNVTQDLKSSEDSLRLWANAKGLTKLRTTISDLRQTYPDKWLTFIGTGDLHHVAAPLIESLPDSVKPVTVIQIDNHPDWFKAPIRYHCGAWVAAVLRKPFVEKVIIVGPNSKDLRGDQFLFMPYGDLANGRIELYPLLREKSLVPLKWKSPIAGVKASKRHWWGTELSFDTVKATGMNKLTQEIVEKLAGKNVYISIDKDVLETNTSITDWDQGLLTLDDLLSFVGKLSAATNVVGVDVCGDQSPDRINGLFKRIDSGRLGERKVDDWSRTNAINEATNLKIIETFEHSLSKQ